MSLTLLQPLHVPRPPRVEDLGADPKVAVEGLSRWAATLSGVLNTFIQQVQEVGEAFITAPSSANLDTGVIQGYQLIVTSALITVAAQIQDAIITNAKVVSLTSDKIYVGSSTSGATLTTAGSTLILPGLLQISAPDSGALALFVKGTANGIQDTAARSLRINGVEQYTTAGTITGISFNTVATSGTAGAITVYGTNATPTARTDLANAILNAAASALLVLSSYAVCGSDAFMFSTGEQNAKNLGSALLAMGLDVGSLEGIIATGGNGGVAGRIPFVGLGFNGGGAGSGLTIYTNGSSNAGAAIYQGYLLGNLPGSAAQFAKTTIIEGGSIRAASIVANKLSVSQLSAIAADMGTINAGTINGGQIISGATSGAHTRMGPSGVQVFDAGGNVVASLSTATNSLTVASGGNISLQAVSGSPAEFVFVDSAGTSIGVISGTNNASIPQLLLVPAVDGTGSLVIGHSTKRWRIAQIWASSSLTLRGGTSVEAQASLTTAGTDLIFASAQLRVSNTEILAYADLRPNVNSTSNLGNNNGRWLGVWVASGALNTIGAATQSSAILAGALSLPTAVSGTLSVLIDGNERRIPFYTQG